MFHRAFRNDFSQVGAFIKKFHSYYIIFNLLDLAFIFLTFIGMK